MLGRMTTAALFALPALGVGALAGERDPPVVRSGIAFIEQITRVLQQGVGHRTDIVQTGGGNRAESILTGAGHRNRIVQQGRDGAVSIHAQGLGHHADITQGAGRDNHAGLRQRGPGANGATILQQGDDNRVRAGQQSFVLGAPGASYFAQQFGSGNRLTAVQAGSDNLAMQLQFGINNTASLFQHGDRNDARLRQEGNDNQAEQTQFGSGLTSQIIQLNDGNVAVSEQIGDNASPVLIIQEGGAAIIVSVQAGG